MPVSLASVNPVYSVHEANSRAPQSSLPEITQGCFETGSEGEYLFKENTYMLKRGAAFYFVFCNTKEAIFYWGLHGSFT